MECLCDGTFICSVCQDKFRASADSITYESVLQIREIRQLRASITDALTLKQFKPCMFLSHRDFALKVQSISKSKAIVNQAKRIIELWDAIKSGVSHD